MESILNAERVGALAGPAIAALATTIAALALAFRPPRDPTLRLAFPFSLCLTLWNVGTLFVFAAPDEDVALAAARWLYYPAVILLPPLFYQILARFTGRELHSGRLALLYAPAAVLLGTVASGHYVQSFHHYWFGYYADGRTIPHLAWIGYYGLLASLSSIDLIRSWNRERDPYRRNQILFIGAGFTVMFAGGTTSLLPLFGIGVYPAGNLASIVFVGTLLWLLARYRLVDFPRFLVRLTLASAIFLSSIVAWLLLLEEGRHWLGESLAFGEPFATSVSATVATLVGVGLLLFGRKVIDGPIRRRFFTDRGGAALDLLEEGRSLASIHDPAELHARLAATLHEAAAAVHGAILRYDEGTARLRVEEAFGPDALLHRGKLIRLGPEAAAWLGRVDRPILALELRVPIDGLGEADQAGFSSVFDLLGAVVFFPFVVQGRLRGGFALGPRVGDGIYGPEEVRLLRLLAQQAAAALENARLYSRLAESNASLRRASDELAELNRNLESKVAARTRELEEASNKVQAADRMKSQFLANMSHELRTPLNSIIGFAEILNEKVASRLEPRHRRFLTNILGSGQHLLGLINDLLDLSKIEAGKMEFYPEPFDVTRVVDGVAGVMKGVAVHASVAIECEIDPTLPPIVSDPVKFKQIVYNLLSNAVKFSPAGSRVLVRGARVPPAASPLGVESLRVDVVDQGIGISADSRDIIFDEFRQADGSTTRQYGGTGLGLALVKRFLELQGGTILVESEVGRGSTFTLFLPMVTSAARPPVPVARPETSTPVPPPSKGSESAGGKPTARILVVEDDPIAYYALSAELEAEGYRAVRARHGEEALREIEADPPDLVVLDIVLPGLDGWEVLKALKAAPGSRDIPVVIVTMSESRELGLALGADDFFVKPAPRETLLTRIRQLVPAGSESERLKILVVDDDPSIHELVGEDLESAGYTVVSAFDGETGLQLARQALPALVLLDLMMPGLTGFDVAARLKSDPVTARIPVVVLTAKSVTAADRAQLGGKISALFNKGTGSRAALIDTVRELVTKRAREVAGGR